MKLRLLLVLSAGVLALTLGASTATAGGDEKSRCKNGGWQTVYGIHLTSFKNEDKCVEYFRAGGKVDPSQSDCEKFAGTFAIGTPPTVWTCTDWHFSDPADFVAKATKFFSDCFRDGGIGGGSIGDPATHLAQTSCTG